MTDPKCHRPDLLRGGSGGVDDLEVAALQRLSAAGRRCPTARRARRRGTSSSRCRRAACRSAATRSATTRACFGKPRDVDRALQPQALAHRRQVGVGQRRCVVARGPHEGAPRARDREAQRVVDLAASDLVVASEAGEDRQAGGVGVVHPRGRSLFERRSRSRRCRRASDPPTREAANSSNSRQCRAGRAGCDGPRRPRSSATRGSGTARGRTPRRTRSAPTRASPRRPR